MKNVETKRMSELKSQEMPRQKLMENISEYKNAYHPR